MKQHEVQTNVARLCVTDYLELSLLGMWNYMSFFIGAITLLGMMVNNLYIILISLTLFMAMTE